MNEDFLKSIGFTLSEYKKLRFYLNCVLPMVVLPFILVVGFFILAPKLSPIWFFITLGLGILLFLLVFYYSNHKTMQHLIFDNMQRHLKEKKKKELLEQDKIMEILQNKKNFWFGFGHYLLLCVFFILIIILIFGLSRLFYYSLLQNIAFYILLLIFMLFAIYLHSTFFTKLKFYETIASIKSIKLIWISALIVNLFLTLIALGLFLVFPYLFPIYFGFCISTRIVFNLNLRILTLK